MADFQIVIAGFGGQEFYPTKEEKGARLGYTLISNHAFVDGNKRASVIFANHFLISHGAGMLIIPDKLVPEFKKQLVGFYESGKEAEIRKYMLDFCMKSYK